MTEYTPTRRRHGRWTKKGDKLVVIKDFSFEPGVLVLSTGSRVTWKVPNGVEPEEHVIKFLGDDHTEVHIKSGHSASKMMDTAGTFEYFCSNYPFMNGILKVEDLMPQAETKMNEMNEINKLKKPKSRKSAKKSDKKSIPENPAADLESQLGDKVENIKKEPETFNVNAALDFLRSRWNHGKKRRPNNKHRAKK